MNGSSKLLITVSTVLFMSILVSTGSCVQGEVTIFADRDTYTSTQSPSMNYSGLTNLRAGYSVGTDDSWESYIHFDFNGKPLGVITTRLHFYVTSVDSTANLSIWRVQDTWDQDTLTLTGGPPAAISFVQYLYISTTGDYSIDITTLVESLSEISFKINSSVVPTGNIVFYSSDFMSGGSDSNPKTVWDYDYTITFPGVPGFEAWVLIGSVIVGIGFTIKRLHFKRG